MTIDKENKIASGEILNYYLNKINIACKTNYVKKATSLPVASEEYKGTILQYTGTDESIYKRGTFYECKLVEDENSEELKYIYKWCACFSNVFVEKETGKGLSTNDYTDEAVEAVSQISSKANSATTLKGYGIEDAYTKEEIDDLFVKNETDKSLISKTDLAQIGTNKTNLETLMADDQTNGSIAKQIADAIGNKDKLSKEVVTEIPDPASANENVIYLILSGENNVYLQYMLIGGAMVSLGSTEINLSNYVTKDDIKDYITIEQVKEYIPSDIVTTSDLETKLDSDQGINNAGNFLVVGEDGKITNRKVTTETSTIELQSREW